MSSDLEFSPLNPTIRPIGPLAEEKYRKLRERKLSFRLKRFFKSVFSLSGRRDGAESPPSDPKSPAFSEFTFGPPMLAQDDRDCERHEEQKVEIVPRWPFPVLDDLQEARDAQRIVESPAKKSVEDGEWKRKVEEFIRYMLKGSIMEDEAILYALAYSTENRPLEEKVGFQCALLMHILRSQSKTIGDLLRALAKNEDGGDRSPVRISAMTMKALAVFQRLGRRVREANRRAQAERERELERERATKAVEQRAKKLAKRRSGKLTGPVLQEDRLHPRFIKSPYKVLQKSKTASSIPAMAQSSETASSAAATSARSESESSIWTTTSTPEALTPRSRGRQEFFGHVRSPLPNGRVGWDTDCSEIDLVAAYCLDGLPGSFGEHLSQLVQLVLHLDVDNTTLSDLLKYVPQVQEQVLYSRNVYDRVLRMTAMQ